MVIPDRHPPPPSVAGTALSTLEVDPLVQGAFEALGVQTIGQLVELPDHAFAEACNRADPEHWGNAYSEAKYILADLGASFSTLDLLAISIRPERPVRTAPRAGLVVHRVPELSVRCLHLDLAPVETRFPDPLMASWEIDGGRLSFQVRPTPPVPGPDIAMLVAGAGRLEGTVEKGEWGALVDGLSTNPRGRVEVTFYDGALGVRAIAEIDLRATGAVPPELRQLVRDLALSLASDT